MARTVSHFRLVAVALVFATIGGLVVSRTATACPFCSASAQTFTQEIGTMDAVVIAKLAKLPVDSQNPGDEISKATFEVADVVKGESLIKPGDKIETLFFGDGKVGQTFLIMGIDPTRIIWSTPLPLSPRGREYLNNVLKLPKDGLERYVFFQNYLEDADDMIARDAYDEFAKAPYATMRELKPHLKHDEIVRHIQNLEIPASRRRLYLVMLGICGTADDLPMLEKYICSTERREKQGLDALIAAYLTLKGADGLALVEELFLKNKDSDYADTYAAIMALRFHGSEAGVIEKSRLTESLHFMLQRPELADLVIPDLAKWEDWSAMSDLMTLYKTADEKNSWVRLPIINYLRACPLPEAKAQLQECERVDPASVERAYKFFPGGATDAPADASKASYVEPPIAAGDVVLASAEMPAPSIPRLSSSMAAGSKVAQASPLGSLETASANLGASPAAALRKSHAEAPNRWLLVGVPWAVGLGLIVVQWSLLRGRR